MGRAGAGIDNSRDMSKGLPPCIITRFAAEPVMRELNPLYNQIKDLKGRDASLRGYL